MARLSSSRAARAAASRCVGVPTELQGFVVEERAEAGAKPMAVSRRSRTVPSPMCGGGALGMSILANVARKAAVRRPAVCRCRRGSGAAFGIIAGRAFAGGKWARGIVIGRPGGRTTILQIWYLLFRLWHSTNGG